MDTIILGIESSCDDTSAAVIKNGVLLSNVVSSQAVHEAYGGVVPELASRADRIFPDKRSRSCAKNCRSSKKIRRSGR